MRRPATGSYSPARRLDGYRFVAQIAGGRARCWTRHGIDLTSRVGALADELVELLPDRSVVDGGLVALASGSYPATV